MRAAAAALEERSRERAAADDPGAAVTYLEALAEPRLLAAAELDVATVRGRIHELLRPTFLETRRSRFLRRSAPAWSADGRYDPATDRVRAPLPAHPADPEEAARLALTDLAVEANEVPEPPSAPYAFADVRIEPGEPAFASIPLEALFLVVYEHDHVRRNQTDRPQP